MKPKAAKGKIIAIIVLAVVIVLEIAVCLFLFLQQRPGKLNRTVKQDEETKEETMKEEPQESEITPTSIEAFAVEKSVAALPTPQEAEEESSADEYLCSYSSERLMTEEDVEELNSATYENLPEGKNIIQMVINEIYARNGYEFQNPEIQSYFEQKEWYQNIAVRNGDMDSVLAGMTDIEKSNVEFLSPYGEEE